MNALRVIAPGMLTTVQDLGRPGYGPLGVSCSGAADPVALRLGNRLLGNPDNAAALEMTLVGGEFEFTRETFLALTGADFSAELDGEAVEMWQSLSAKAGQVLRVGATRNYARCYLCICGGIIVKPFLGSASTHLLSGLGGFDGRALRKGDELRIGDSQHSTRNLRVRHNALSHLMPTKRFRVTAGPQRDWFGEQELKTFYASEYKVTESANRMGLRLQGSAVSLPANRTMISEGVALGAIQITHSGQPIILFVEQQTTGGYPKVANIISADLASAGQLRPRDAINFELVSLETARQLLIEQEHLLWTDNLIEEVA